MAKKEHRKHVRDLLATAIVHKTLDMEVNIFLFPNDSHETVSGVTCSLQSRHKFGKCSVFSKQKLWPASLILMAVEGWERNKFVPRGQLKIRRGWGSEDY